MKAAILTPRFRGQVRALPKDVRREVGRVISEVEQRFGQSHLHGGVGIRKLCDEHFECRVGLKLRLVFADAPEGLVFELAGDHAAVERFLRSL